MLGSEVVHSTFTKICFYSSNSFWVNEYQIGPVINDLYFNLKVWFTGHHNCSSFGGVSVLN